MAILNGYQSCGTNKEKWQIFSLGNVQPHSDRVADVIYVYSIEDEF